jgi:hypothetical protein
MHLKFWDEAFSTTACLINRLPSRVIDFSSPFEKLFGSTPDYPWLKVFGCACWPHLRPYNTRKLELCSKKFVFLGYSSSHKGYKCLDIVTGRVYVSRDVVFDENVFPFSQLHPNVGAQLHAEIQLPPPMLCTPLENDVDNHVANGANSGLEHVDVQAEELTDLQAGAHSGAEYSAKNSVVAAMDLIVMADLAKFALDLVSANRPGYALGLDSGSVPNSLPSSALTSVPTTSTQVDTRQHRIALVSVLL